jgi:hypothetical protein
MSNCPKADKIWTRLDNFKLHLVKIHRIEKKSSVVDKIVQHSSRSRRGFFQFAKDLPSLAAELRDGAFETELHSHLARNRGRDCREHQRKRGPELGGNRDDADNKRPRSIIKQRGNGQIEPEWELLTTLGSEANKRDQRNDLYHHRNVGDNISI